MSTYTIQIYMAGLLAFAVTKGPNGMVDGVTLLVPRADGNHGSVEAHVPFVVWADKGISSNCPSTQADAIFQSLVKTNAPSGWGGCMLDSEEISITSAGPLENWQNPDLARCSAPKAELEEFCWVPLMGLFSGDKDRAGVDVKHLTSKKFMDLAARFSFGQGRLKTFHLAEADGSVYYLKSLEPNDLSGKASYTGVTADIAVLEIRAEAGVSLKLEHYNLQGNHVGDRTVEISAANNADVRRILIANLPAADSCPNAAQSDHFARLYDLTKAGRPTKPRLPSWDVNYPHWKNSLWGNPDFTAMPEPLFTLYNAYSKACPKMVFQRPVCPMATFQ